MATITSRELSSYPWNRAVFFFMKTLHVSRFPINAFSLEFSQDTSSQLNQKGSSRIFRCEAPLYTSMLLCFYRSTIPSQRYFGIQDLCTRVFRKTFVFRSFVSLQITLKLFKSSVWRAALPRRCPRSRHRTPSSASGQAGGPGSHR